MRKRLPLSCGTPTSLSAWGPLSHGLQHRYIQSVGIMDCVGQTGERPTKRQYAITVRVITMTPSNTRDSLDRRRSTMAARCSRRI